MLIVILVPLAIVASSIIRKTYRKKKIMRTCTQKNTSLLPTIRSPHNVIVVFDLHGVVFRHDYVKMFRSFWRSPDKWRIVWATINPRLWLDVLIIARDYTVPEAFIMQLAKQHETIKQLLPSIIHIMNAQKPHQPTVALMHRLKKTGYTLDVLSNIGETIYRDMEQLFPEILSLFNTVVVTCAANCYTSKPNPKLYQVYLSTVQDNQSPLFIDDKIKNIQSALDCGIASIYYDSADEATEVLKKLIPF